MDATKPPRPSPGGDFVVVEDSGEFSYYASVDALLADLEYVGEATCIIDRSATAYRLELGREQAPAPGCAPGCRGVPLAAPGLGGRPPVAPRRAPAPTRGDCRARRARGRTVRDAATGTWHRSRPRAVEPGDRRAFNAAQCTGRRRPPPGRERRAGVGPRDGPVRAPVPSGMAPKTPALGPRRIPQLHRDPCPAQVTRPVNESRR